MLPYVANLSFTRRACFDSAVSGFPQGSSKCIEEQNCGWIRRCHRRLSVVISQQTVPWTIDFCDRSSLSRKQPVLYNFSNRMNICIKSLYIMQRTISEKPYITWNITEESSRTELKRMRNTYIGNHYIPGLAQFRSVGLICGHPGWMRVSKKHHNLNLLLLDNWADELERSTSLGRSLQLSRLVRRHFATVRT